MLPSVSTSSGNAPSSTESTAVNASAPNASAPNASAPNASAPNASAPDATAAPKVPVDFVNLYDVLKMQVASSSSELRKRITEMYLEAQKNLDHRNLQKKMYFQQLYEVYLPQARHLLLDVKRRAEYDTFLNVYNEDQVKHAAVKEVLEKRERREKEATGEVQTTTYEIAEEPIEALMTPEELAAHRAEQWRRWQEGLEKSGGDLEQLSFSPVELEARAVERKDYIERVMVEVREESKKMEAERERLRQEELARREIEQQKAREAEFERRRQMQFEDDVDSLISTARLCWGFGVGAACFLLGFSLLFVLDVYFSSQGANRDTFRLICLGITAVGCAIGGWRGASHGTARIKKMLAQRTNLHVEAEKKAAIIVAQRKKMEGDAKAHRPGHHVREAEALRLETYEQMRVMRRADLDSIAGQNISTGWSFGAGEIVFALGFAIMWVVDMGLARSGSTSRPMTAFVGWALSFAASIVAARVASKFSRKLAPKTADTSSPTKKPEQPTQSQPPQPKATQKPQAR